MFETYANSLIGRGLDAQVSGNNVTSPHLVVLDSDSGGSAYDRFVVLAATPASGSGGPAVIVYGWTDGLAPGANAVVQTLSVAGQPAALASVAGTKSGAAGPPLVLMAAPTGAFTLFNFSAASGQLAQAAQGFFAGFPSPNATLLGAEPVCSPSACYALLLQAGPGNATTINVVALAAPRSVLASAVVQTGVQVDAGGSLSLAPAASSDTASATSSFAGLAVYAGTAVTDLRARLAAGRHPEAAARLAAAAAQCPLADAPCNGSAVLAAWHGWTPRDGPAAAVTAGELEAALDVLGVHADSGRTYLYGAYVALTITDGAGSLPAAMLSVERYGAPSAAPVRLGFGSAPHVYVTSFNGTLLALETHTDGTCQSGLLYNNGDWSRCFQLSPAADDDLLYAFFQQVQYLLNYNYGTLAAFRGIVNAAYAPLSMCNTGIVSGKFENGLSPSGALFAQTVVYTNDTAPQRGTPAGPHLEVGMLAAHDGDVLCPIVTTAFCGSPLPKPGIVFDQFHLPQPWQLPG
jgi:hypothetical protein